MSFNFSADAVQYGRDSAYYVVDGGDGPGQVIPGNVEITGNLTVDGTTTLTGAVSALSLAATNAVTAASVTATGAVAGASVAATGAVSGASVAATGAVTGATVAATGAVSGASLALTGSMTSANINSKTSLQAGVGDGITVNCIDLNFYLQSVRPADAPCIVSVNIYGSATFANGVPWCTALVAVPSRNSATGDLGFTIYGGLDGLLLTTQPGGTTGSRTFAFSVANQSGVTQDLTIAYSIFGA